MPEKINWDNVPVEEVTPSMHRKMIWGEKIMVAKMKFKDGFVASHLLLIRANAILVWREQRTGDGSFSR
jgi:hypothetical protein